MGDLGWGGVCIGVFLHHLKTYLAFWRCFSRKNDFCFVELTVIPPGGWLVVVVGVLERCGDGRGRGAYGTIDIPTGAYSVGCVGLRSRMYRMNYDLTIFTFL